MTDIHDIIDHLPDQSSDEVIPALPRKRKALKASQSMSEIMRERHRDPAFAAAHRERGRTHMQRMNKDPDFNEKRLEALRAACSDPEVRERMRSSALKRWARARGEN